MTWKALNYIVVMIVVVIVIIIVIIIIIIHCSPVSLHILTI